MTERPTRRQWLLTVGLAGVAGVAGCSTESPAAESTAPPETGTQTAGSVSSQRRTVDGLSLRLTRPTLLTAYRAGGHTHTASDGAAFLAVRLRAETTADSSVAHPRASDVVATTGGEQRESRLEHGEFSGTVSGAAYSETDQARSGAVSEGWLVFEVDRSTESARVSWNDSATDRSTAWTVSVSPGALPALAVTDFSGPAAAERYDAVPLALSVENTGGQSGTFTAEITAGALEDAVPVQFTVPAGESVDRSVDIDYPAGAGLGTQFTLTDASSGAALASTTVDYEVPTRAFGDSYETPRGGSVTLSRLQFADEITYESEYSTPATAGSNQKFALVYVTATASAEQNTAIPVDDALELTAGTGGYEVRILSDYDELTSPVTGSGYGQFFDEVGPGEAVGGWVAFEIPAGLRAGDIAVRWEYSDYVHQDFSVRWQ